MANQPMGKQSSKLTKLICGCFIVKIDQFTWTGVTLVSGVRREVTYGEVLLQTNRSRGQSPRLIRRRLALTGWSLVQVILLLVCNQYQKS